MEAVNQLEFQVSKAQKMTSRNTQKVDELVLHLIVGLNQFSAVLTFNSFQWILTLFFSQTSKSTLVWGTVTDSDRLHPSLHDF